MLTAKQQRFIDEYLIDLNATQAAIRAGYSEKTAYSQGQRLLKKVEISEEIAKRQKQRLNQNGITADRILSEYASIAFADIRNIISWNAEGVTVKPSAELQHGEAANIAEVREGAAGVTVKLHSKLDALEQLAKYVGLLDSSVSGDAQPLNITFQVAEPKGEVKITRGEG